MGNHKHMISRLKEKFPNGIVHGILSGHGRVVNGEYSILRPGSKQFHFDDGLSVYEGEINAKIKDRILNLSDCYGPREIETVDLNPYPKDSDLDDRVAFINQTFDDYAEDGKLLLVWEIHCNAGGGTGSEFYTTRGDNYSDQMATELAGEFRKAFMAMKIRADYRDGDVDKEKDFYVIKNIKTFGVLAECFFFDNRYDVDTYNTSKGKEKIANAFLNAMDKISQDFS